jgi:hypothetical protein
MKKSPSKRPTATEEALQLAAVRIQPINVALRLWERVLTDAERAKLGGDFEAAYAKGRAVGMWMALHNTTKARAVVEVAHKSSLLSDADYVWLRREIGEPVTPLPPTPPPVRPVPQWSPADGTLKLRGAVIRRIKVNQSPTNVQKIIDAFENAGWTSRIPNPLPHGQQQLHQALRTLKVGLTKIRFHSLEGGKSIRWSTI